MQFQTPAEWRAHIRHHHARLTPDIEAHRARRSRGQKHPVWDFLWEYYSFKPAQLLRWSPGLGVELLEAAPDFAWKEMSPTSNGVVLDPQKFPQHRLQSARDTLELLRQTAGRPAFHGCFGLHEWAMVYRGPARHSSPLRLSDDAIADLVETQTVRCSHFDAFRFFTPAARPLNVLQPAPDDRAAHEQPGCIHANMDLYRHSTKFYPWISSDLIADCFVLMREARLLDMRAAPYDLNEFGVEPIAIETAPGRARYAELQRAVAERAAPLRARLSEEYQRLVSAIENEI